MKKIINDPSSISSDMMEGYLGVFGEIIDQVEHYTSVSGKTFHLIRLVW